MSKVWTGGQSWPAGLLFKIYCGPTHYWLIKQHHLAFFPLTSRWQNYHTVCRLSSSRKYAGRAFHEHMVNMQTNGYLTADISCWVADMATAKQRCKKIWIHLSIAILCFVTHCFVVSMLMNSLCVFFLIAEQLDSSAVICLQSHDSPTPMSKHTASVLQR